MTVTFMFLQGSLQANDNMFLYGTELSPQSAYLYAGTIVPVVYDEDQYFLRLWSDVLMYEYAAPPLTIDAESKNLQFSLGRQFTHDLGWFNAYLGYALNNTQLKPDDVNNDSRGSHSQLILSVDGEYDLSSCEHRLNYGVSYALDQAAYWFRIRPVCWTYQQKKIGFEWVNHGDKNYRHTQLGGLIYNEEITQNTVYTLKGGLTITQDSSVFPYIGVEFTTMY